MAELFLELFSEEIPARMQEAAAAALSRLVTEALEPLAPAALRTWHGPRRIALAARLAPGVAASEVTERGPRTAAPPQALEGFLRKHAAPREALTQADGYWILRRTRPGADAAQLVAQALPGLLRRFPWPKSMRWGRGSAFTWVRPLRRIVCLLDAAPVPFTLAEGADPAHGLASGTQSEGHRFMAPEPFTVLGAEQWVEALAARHVVAAAPDRRALIEDGLTRLAAAEGLHLVEDAPLLDEVANLVEWPVPMLGRIDAAFMDLPPEVMQVSMRVNQRYFALRSDQGAPAPRFAFVANIAAADGGATIVAGNERVLRARFSDARHFWDLDRRVRLESRLAALERVTFHARLGSQRARVDRIVALARALSPHVGADPALAARAALLCKADLTTGMVGEFPELQGVMGGYYARHDGEPDAVACAIRDHYAPRGPNEAAPRAPTSQAVALADKLDQLVAFFGIGEQPSGSGDPFGLRRAALGVIRIVREGGLRIPLGTVLAGTPAATLEALRGFFAERLRVQLRAEGARHDVLSAVFAAAPDDDLLRLLTRAEALAAFLAGPEGADLLAGTRRAANIVRIEDRKDGPHTGPVDPALLVDPAEQALAAALDAAEPAIERALAAERYAEAMGALAQLRPALDALFETVTVNAPDPALRANRLRLLARVAAVLGHVADLSKIET